jgi:hypothetical protein
MLEGREHWLNGKLSQGTKAFPLDLLGNAFERYQIRGTTRAGGDLVEDL